MHICALGGLVVCGTLEMLHEVSSAKLSLLEHLFDPFRISLRQSLPTYKIYAVNFKLRPNQQFDSMRLFGICRIHEFDDIIRDG